MKLKLGLAALAWTLLVLAMLLTGCAHTSPPSKPVPPPAIPPLPAEAKQASWPTFSRNVQALFQRWQDSLTTPSSEDKPAKLHMDL
jgi:hypothetical protein